MKIYLRITLKGGLDIFAKVTVICPPLSYESYLRIEFFYFQQGPRKLTKLLKMTHPVSTGSPADTITTDAVTTGSPADTTTDSSATTLNAESSSTASSTTAPSSNTSAI
uniref:Uncharacterized protein n=1 Tax=Cacopsylla melanoneura TaxID=428564 RepID=A0A8D9A3C7_9HEMI